MSKEKILLVNPAPKNRGLSESPYLAIPPLNLRIIKGLTEATDPEIQVEIVDELKKPIDPYLKDKSITMVGITSMTPTAPRAYAISEGFREIGVKTMLGGIHPSLLTEEASRHADSVVQGEVEEVWPKVIIDLKKGELEPVYKGGRIQNMDLIPDVGKADGYVIDFTTQSMRGCPGQCEFCSVTVFNGRKVRRRSPERVIREIRKQKEKGVKRMFFADDNIYPKGTSNLERSREFFQAMVDQDFGIDWASQTGIEIGLKENEPALELAQKSGCVAFFIGFESLDPEVLKAYKKRSNEESLDGQKGYMDQIKRIRDHGIIVVGGFILGNDNDDLGVFERTLQFVEESGIDVPQYSILTPLPGTPLFDRVRDEGRLLYTNFPEDWARYDLGTPVIKFKNMTEDQFIEGMDNLYKHSTRITSILRRSLSSLLTTKKPIAFPAVLLTNLGYNSQWKYYLENLRDTDSSETQEVR